MKIGETVFYVINGQVSIGRVARRYDFGKFVVVPFLKGKQIVVRKESRLFPAKNYKKYIDIQPNI